MYVTTERNLNCYEFTLSPLFSYTTLSSSLPLHLSHSLPHCPTASFPLSHSAPRLQFQYTNYTLTLPDSSIEICLKYTATNAVYIAFEAEVTFSKQEGMTWHTLTHISQRVPLVTPYSYDDVYVRERVCRIVHLCPSVKARSFTTIALAAMSCFNHFY